MRATGSRTPPGRQIVVGVDGSAASAAAVRWAVQEARLRHAAVRLVCAYHDDDRLHAPYASWCWAGQAERRAAAREMLDRAAELARTDLPPGWLLTELADEPPARALLDRSAGAEMLVLGTSRPPVQPDETPQAIGPVARVCLRRAHCPVVVVTPDNPAGGQGIPQPAGTLATAGGRRSALPHQASVPLG
jgi:nucleotide-binding universal stress UspA family protein